MAIVGKERKDHKYVARVKLTKTSGKKKNTYRYFYDLKEYQAYLKGEEKKKKEDLKKQNDKNPFSKLFADIDKKIDKSLSKVEKVATKNFKELTSKGKKSVDKFVASNKNKKVKELDSISIDFKETADFIKSIVTGGVGKKIQNAIIESAVSKKSNNTENTQSASTTGLKTKDKEWTKEEDMTVINPNYTPYDWAYSNNCSYCTTAYEFRRRGYDVEAMPIRETDDNPSHAELMSWYEGAERVGMSDIAEESGIDMGDDFCDFFDLIDEGGAYVTQEQIDYGITKEALEAVEKKMVENGDGARGNLMVYWTGYTSGHSMVWEVENSKVVIRDCQTNDVYDLTDFEERLNSLSYFRTDNLEFTEEAKRVVRNRK